jgi:hypothetical protein
MPTNQHASPPHNKNISVKLRNEKLHTRSGRHAYMKQVYSPKHDQIRCDKMDMVKSTHDKGKLLEHNTP